jgi:RNA-binding protein
MTLSTKYKQQLKAQAHPLNPIVYIGTNGFTDSVRKEIERALHDHELIKIRILETDRQLRQLLFTEICQATTAHPIQLIGKVGILYRKSDK